MHYDPQNRKLTTGKPRFLCPPLTLKFFLRFKERVQFSYCAISAHIPISAISAHILILRLRAGTISWYVTK